MLFGGGDHGLLHDALYVATTGSPSREDAHRIIETQKCQFCFVKLMIFEVPLQERMLIESSELRNVSFAY